MVYLIHSKLSPRERTALVHTYICIFQNSLSFIYLNHFKKDTGFGMVASYPKWSSSHLVILKQFFRVLLLESSYRSSQGIIKLGNRTHIEHLCMQNRKQKSKKRAEEISRILKNSKHRVISILTLGSCACCGCFEALYRLGSSLPRACQKVKQVCLVYQSVGT